MKTNTNGQSFKIGDKITVKTNRSRYKGMSGVINSWAYMDSDNYTPTGVNIILNSVHTHIKLSINSIGYYEPPKQIIKDGNGDYVVACKTSNKLIKKDVSKARATYLAKELLNSGKSEEVLIYRAIERITKDIKVEKIT